MKTFSKIFILFLIVLTGVSCQSSVDLSRTTLLVEQQPEPPINSADLAYELSQKTWCSNDEAFSMMLLMVAEEDRCLNFNERHIELTVKGLADGSWDLNPTDPITKGTMAYMVIRALKLKTGVMMHLLPSRRYAYREALHHQLMSPGSANEPLTAPEVIGILGRAARWMENQP